MIRLNGLNTGLFRAGDRVCCAVSGGADSVALLFALGAENAQKEPLGLVLSAVHVHHGLRGTEADGDERFVRELCARLGVPLVVERVDTAARQATEREGLEEAARELRYAVFRRLLTDGRADLVATAHTLDDQAETVVMKLLRGAWTEGLGGISPVLEMSEPAGMRIGVVGDNASDAQAKGRRVLRPLLGVRRAEIETFLRDAGQSWCEDSSNRDLSLTRNRVRHELMPTLRGFNPGLDGLLGRTAAIARDEESYWRAEISRLLPGLLLPGKPVRGGGRAVSTAVGERSAALELDRLRALAPAVRRRILRAAAQTLGCRIGAEDTAKLLALAGLEPYAGSSGGSIQGRIGARLVLTGGLRAERSARELRFSRGGT